MLSIPHLIVIFVVALVIFGPEKLPELARNLGKVMAEFRRHTGDLRSTFEGHLRDIEREGEARRVASTPPAVSAAPSAPTETSSSAAQAPVPAPASPGTVPATPPWEDPPDPDLRRREEVHADVMVTDSASPEARPSESEKEPERVSDGDVRPS